MFKTEDIVTGDKKLVSRSKARVIANEDPQKKGRIRVFHPLLGESGFIPYLSAPGSFSVPDVDDVVYLEAEAGYDSHPVAWGNLNSESDGSPDYPDVFQRVTPSNRGFFTPGGHLIELDDGQGLSNTGEGVRITTSGGIIIDLNDTEDSVTISTSAGNSTVFDSSGITSTDTFGNSITMSESGIALEDVTGNTITTSDTGIVIETTAGAELSLANGKVALGNDVGELLQQLVTLLQAFTTAAPTFVSTAVGPGVLDPTLVTAISDATTTLTGMQGSL